jgi:hypothetical protein
MIECFHEVVEGAINTILNKSVNEYNEEEIKNRLAFLGVIGVFQALIASMPAAQKNEVLCQLSQIQANRA